jgi:putative ABC transport system substrate-binding protein
LISYGTRLVDGFHQVGVYTGRILQGARPADLPIVQRSEKIELVINLKTARALDLTVPPSILGRVDDVIE